MAKKHLILNQPNFGDLSQYNFDDTTDDFDYDNDLLDSDKYTEIDKWIVEMANSLQEEIKQDYDMFYEAKLVYDLLLRLSVAEKCSNSFPPRLLPKHIKLSPFYH